MIGIAPGYMSTENATAFRANPVRGKSILERILAGRPGLPEDVKVAMVFIASAAYDYVNGSVLLIMAPRTSPVPWLLLMRKSPLKAGLRLA